MDKILGDWSRDFADIRVISEFAADSNDDLFEGQYKAVSIFDVTEGRDCVVHAYDARYNPKAERIYLQTGYKLQMSAETNRSHKAALVLVRLFNPDKALRGMSLEIRSPYIRTALQEVIKSYPGTNIQSNSHIVLHDEPQRLWHYRRELQAYATTNGAQNRELKAHLWFLIRDTSFALQKECIPYKRTMQGSDLAPGLEYDLSWMAFKPVNFLYGKTKNIEIAYRLFSIAENSNQNAKDHMTGTLEIGYIAYDGKVLGHVRSKQSVERYHGYKPFTALKIFPIQYHPDKERIKIDLLSRGRKYVTLLSSHYVAYEGVADVRHRRDRSRRYEDDDYEYMDRQD